MQSHSIVINEGQDNEQEVSLWAIARAINTPEMMAEVVERWLNTNFRDFPAGQEVGRELRSTHRTLQRSAVGFALGILCGISEQEFTDPRNQTAIDTAKDIKAAVNRGDFPIGPFV